jgi:Zn-dependent protease with chaperone function
MTSQAQLGDRVQFPGIAPAAFEHPVDRMALDVLRRTPGLDRLFKKLASLGFERQVRLHFTADSLRLGPKQCPRIYRLFQEAANTLDMPEPELYLMQFPVPNAVAIGLDRHTLVVTSALVDLLSEDELRFVLGHELGHMKSGHMLYRTIAYFLAIIGLVAARNLPLVNLVSQAMLLAFYDWFRKSELTADRAGLLVAQDSDVAVRSLLKLAGGAQKTADDLDVNEFLRQADDFEDMDESLLNVLYKFDMIRFQSHPFPAPRAREIAEWAKSEAYRAALRGDYPRSEGKSEERRCGRCGARTSNPLYRFCPECGGAL